MMCFRLFPEVRIVFPMERQFANRNSVTTGVTFHKSPHAFVTISVHSPACRLPVGRQEADSAQAGGSNSFALFACFAVKK